MIHKGDRTKTPLAKSEQPSTSGLPTTPLAPATGRYWSDPFSAVQEFDRYFDAVRRNMESLIFPTSSALWPSAAIASNQPSARPARVDLMDQGKEYILSAEVPGFDRDQIEVEVTENGIELSAQRAEEKSEGSEQKGYLARERSYQTLHRFMEFPEEVDCDNVNAELKNGVLTVTVPKAHPSEERKTKVKIN